MAVVGIFDLAGNEDDIDLQGARYIPFKTPCEYTFAVKRRESESTLLGRGVYVTAEPRFVFAGAEMRWAGDIDLAPLRHFEMHLHEAAKVTELHCEWADLPAEIVAFLRSRAGRTRPVVLRGLSEGPIVLGRRKAPLTRAGYDVVLALIEAGDEGLDKAALETRSRHSDARRILRGLRASDPDWAAVLQMAGKAYSGYRILNPHSSPPNPHKSD